ncbi:MAG: Cof-type HAD-IIB family hydrolase [Pirellulales bacterium]
MTFRYRMLAVDVDGTLVNSRDELTLATREALLRAARKGVEVVLATGRRYSRTLPLVEPLAIDVPLVTAGGALIKDPADHRTLFQAAFDRQLLREVLAVVDESGFETLLYGDTFAEGFDFYCRQGRVAQPALAEYLELNPECERIWPELVTDPPAGIFAGFTMGTRDEMLSLDARLKERLPGKLFTNVLRSPRYRGYMCEIAPSGITKWSGVCRLAALRGIPEDAICAVGDDVNDIPMIAGAGLGVAMGNAQDEVKAAADRVAPTHDEDGLVEVVRWLLA